MKSTENVMKKDKKRIILDVDDTIIKSSEQIIRMICKKYGVNKNIEDLKDWGYKSIYKFITKQEIMEMYSSDVFFKEVELNTGVVDFIREFKDIYSFCFCTKGSKENLGKKLNYCKKLLGDKEFDFYGIEFDKENNGKHELDKSAVVFDDVVFCVDDNSFALKSLNCKNGSNQCLKFLIKNYRDFYWNKSEEVDNCYVVNDFFDIIEVLKWNN